MVNIIDHLYTHPPGYGPEWGSGGVFGLKYYRGVLYYTLAFEAKAYFYDHGGIRRVYDYSLVGKPPTSGGDTYNAVAVVDDRIYFGGWVHAPAIYRGRNGRGATIDFRNKYSHIHYYDIGNDEVKLLWKESIHHPEKWAGEVSEIIYNPYIDELLIARGDGHVNLGIYSIDPRSGESKKLLDHPVIYGTQHIDHACFSIHKWEYRGVVCIDMINHEKKIYEINDLSKISIDGEPTHYPLDGAVASLMNKLYMFIRGGVVHGDPLDPEFQPLRYTRLLDLGKAQLGAHRINPLYIGGGILVAFNTYTHAVMNPVDEEGKKAQKYMNTLTSPTLLLYFSPPSIKIIATLGARVTSMERIGDKIVLATNTQANLGWRDASPFDIGIRDFTILPINIINNQPPPVTITIPPHMHTNTWMGGIPLQGYREPKLVVETPKPVKLYIKPVKPLLDETEETETINLEPGRNTIDLSNYKPTLPLFKYEVLNDKLWTHIILE